MLYTRHLYNRTNVQQCRAGRHLDGVHVAAKGGAGEVSTVHRCHQVFAEGRRCAETPQLREVCAHVRHDDRHVRGVDVALWVPVYAHEMRLRRRPGETPPRIEAARSPATTSDSMRCQPTTSGINAYHASARRAPVAPPNLAPAAWPSPVAQPAMHDRASCVDMPWCTSNFSLMCSSVSGAYQRWPERLATAAHLLVPSA